MTPEMRQKLKDAGLDLAEESVKDLVENAIEALKVVIEITENKYDDMALPLLDLAAKAALAAADKIDGKEG